MQSSMLDLFRRNVPSYRPEVNGLVLESGDPAVSLENVRRLMQAGLVIRDIWIKPCGALLMFNKGDQYYAPGLRVGTTGPATEALVEIAAKAHFGPADRLMRFYSRLPADYDDQLPPVMADEQPPA